MAGAIPGNIEESVKLYIVSGYMLESGATRRIEFSLNMIGRFGATCSLFE